MLGSRLLCPLRMLQMSPLRILKPKRGVGPTQWHAMIPGHVWDPRGTHVGPTWDPRGPTWDLRGTHVGPTWDLRGPTWDPRGPAWDRNVNPCGPTWEPCGTHVDPTLDACHVDPCPRGTRMDPRVPRRTRVGPSETHVGATAAGSACSRGLLAGDCLPS